MVAAWALIVAYWFKIVKQYWFNISAQFVPYFFAVVFFFDKIK
jgi:hypothetical protein